MLNRIPVSTPTDRRIRREARSAARRAQALALRQSGATYAEIGAALDLAQLTRRELLATPNFGRVACDAVVAWLARHGLTLNSSQS